MQSPILKAIFDIWYETDIASELIPGKISDVCGYTKLKELPLSRVPKDIIINDNNLKYQPLYELYDENKPYIITVGHKAIGLKIENTYEGWEESFLPEIKEIYSKIIDQKILKKILRYGLRYINFFENENILQTSKISIKINDNEISDSKVTFINEKVLDDITTRVIVDNQIELENKKGSILDIVSFNDTVQEEVSIETLIEVANKLHTSDKDYFKEVINDELSRELNL